MRIRRGCIKIYWNAVSIPSLFIFVRVKVDTGLHDIWSAIIIHYFRILMFLLLMQIFNYNCVHTLCDNAYPKVNIIRGRQELRIGNINIHALALRLLLIKFMVLISLLLQKKHLSTLSQTLSFFLLFCLFRAKNTCEK